MADVLVWRHFREVEGSDGYLIHGSRCQMYWSGVILEMSVGIYAHLHEVASDVGLDWWSTGLG